MSIAQSWNTADEEQARSYPCDSIITGTTAALYRAIDVDAPAAVVFRWLCQLRVAPYSYDWIDNFGRQSPQELTPGREVLTVGQPVMRIFDLVSFEQDRQITIRLRQQPAFARHIFGDVAVSYVVVQPVTGVAASRIVAKIAVRYPPPPHGWLVRLLLPWGDLIMMRKQLLNLRRLAERDARTSG